MEILVTGANGFVGRHLILALQKRGDSIRALSSPRGDTTWLQQHDIAIFRGDIRNQETLTEPMRGVDAVVHLVAETKKKWGSMQSSYAVNVAGTENVCRAALAAHVQRFIHVSTAAIYDMGVGRPVTEDDLLKPLDDPYCFTKAQGDNLVQRMIREDHLPAVIIRLGALLGPGDSLNFGRLADRVRAGKGIIVGSGNNAISFVYITDVVQALLLALDSEQAVGHSYNISNDQTLTQKQYLSAIAQEMGVAPPRIHVPYYPMYAAAYVAERITALSGYRIPPIVTRHGIKILGEDGRLSIEKARNELGYVPQVSIRDAVRLTSDWYQQQESWTPEKGQVTATR
ncbi:MAG: NAD-dependent epimerase/dehydratase family protein [Ktedonobacteraceae bacterium]